MRILDDLRHLPQPVPQPRYQLGLVEVPGGVVGGEQPEVRVESDQALRLPSLVEHHRALPVQEMGEETLSSLQEVVLSLSDQLSSSAGLSQS